MCNKCQEFWLICLLQVCHSQSRDARNCSATSLTGQQRDPLYSIPLILLWVLSASLPWHSLSLNEWKAIQRGLQSPWKAWKRSYSSPLQICWCTTKPSKQNLQGIVLNTEQRFWSERYLDSFLCVHEALQDFTFFFFFFFELSTTLRYWTVYLLKLFLGDLKMNSIWHLRCVLCNF